MSSGGGDDKKAVTCWCRLAQTSCNVCDEDKSDDESGEDWGITSTSPRPEEGTDPLVMGALGGSDVGLVMVST